MLKTSKIDFIVVIVAFLILFFSSYFIMSENASMIILTNKLSMIWPIISIFLVLKSLRSVQSKQLLLVLGIVIISFLCVNLTATSGIRLKYMSFVSFVLWIYICANVRFNYADLKKMFLVLLGLSILYPFFYRSGFSLTEEGYYLSLNFPNTNLAGLFIAQSVFFLILMIFAIQQSTIKKIYRYLFVISFAALAVFEIIMVFYTGTRSSLMAISFFLFFVFLEILGKKVRFTKFWLFVGSLIPLLFVFLYFSYQSFFSMKYLNEILAFEYKPLESRISGWEIAFDIISQNFFLGKYGEGNPLNSHLDVLLSYGIFVFLLFVVFLYETLKASAFHADTQFKRLSLIAFLACLVNSSAESALVCGSNGLYLLSGGFILFANSNNQ